MCKERPARSQPSMKCPKCGNELEEGQTAV